MCTGLQRKELAQDKQDVSGALVAQREMQTLLGGLVLLSQLRIILGLAAE